MDDTTDDSATLNHMGRKCTINASTVIHVRGAFANWFWANHLRQRTDIWPLWRCVGVQCPLQAIVLLILWRDRE